MIVKELLTVNLTEYVRTYSSEGYRIRKDDTDEVYDEAVDLARFGYTYTETDEPIYYGDATEEDYIAALAELGVETE